ncbi:MAG: COX15/CtaA family protein [Flavobacteriales bacterium]|nr:COX15/CtaA family protein [Flavobacteriales bacterium]
MIPPLFHFIRRVSYIALVCVLLVILAGSVVRMTDAGMGCPDWPKCYGHLIPPTQKEQVEFLANKKFRQGEMIIFNDSLWVANGNFQTTSEFSRNDWHKYPKHNYAKFDVAHTWIENINRWLGAFTGLPILLLFGACILWLYRQKDIITFLMSLSLLFMLGFVAWLGKLVVDGNLQSGSITLHMLGSMFLVFMLVFLIRRFHPARQEIAFTKYQKLLPVIFMFLVITQIILGTQVRESVDEFLKSGIERNELSNSFDFVFYVHRSFSILLVLVGLAMFKYTSQHPSLKTSVLWIAIFVGLELFVGIVLSYFSMPAALQPVHLLCAMFTFLFTSRVLAKIYTPTIASGS